MDSLFEPIASATGASIDQIKLIVCLLVSYPLGSTFIRIPPSLPVLKHIFNLSVALIYFLPVLNLWSGFSQLVVTTLATYYVAKNVRTPAMPRIVFAFVLGHLMINHIIRAVVGYGYETFEITGPQMVLTMKLTTFAWNVFDGRRPREDLDKWQLEKHIPDNDFPSLLAFLGYAFYFPGVLVGPYLDYNSYKSLVDGSVFKIAESHHQPKNEHKGRRIPAGRKTMAYRKMLKGLVFLGLFTTCYGSFSYEVAMTPWFPKKNILYRIAYWQLCGFFERTKYYAIWTLTEGASILTGYGFTGFDAFGNSTWDGARNIRVRSIEFAPNFKVLLDSWNIKTAIWLRECVYKRVTPKGKKPGFRSSMITFVTSAVWHGIAPGYYLAFLLGGFIQTAGRLCRTNIRPLLLPAPLPPSQNAPVRAKEKLSLEPPKPPRPTAKFIYDILGTVSSVLLVNYTTGPFILLTADKSFYTWRLLGWYGHVMVGGTLVFFYAGGRRVLRKMQEKRVKNLGMPLQMPAVGDVRSTDGPLYMPPVEEFAQEFEHKLEEVRGPRGSG
ncbi:MBOAT-domain-containing protein [Neolentinus lepideus HHB14362 ss-1]|uniref:MBOAT-domain-containing protein n=1 Tax=Neolentinus lepideus HHB14362 ss-1 TaxID=1314782 RepID=A0A165P8D2_9AGAM|nr:MBOAT-domain-containing protein [Neolentinus lepideus HHB14362 ss-1]